jgi:hypothetical protein
MNGRLESLPYDKTIIRAVAQAFQPAIGFPACDWLSSLRLAFQPAIGFPACDWLSSLRFLRCRTESLGYGFTGRTS